MTNVYFQDTSGVAHVEGVVRALAGGLPAHAAISSRDDAAIVVGVDGAITDGSAWRWLLVWGNGKPFTSLYDLREAVCHPYAVLELHLLACGEHGYLTLRKAAFSTLPGRYDATVACARDCAVALVVQTLVDHENGVLAGTPFIAADMTQSAPLVALQPEWRQSMRLNMRWVMRRVESILFHENWMIGWIDASITESIHWKVCPPVRWIGPRTADRYLADPFAWPRQNNIILCEEYDFSTRLGRIRQLTVEGAEIQHESAVDFGLTGHLSYPFIFEQDGAIYCLPESSAARRLTIYRWDEPGGWREYAMPLTDIAAADSILFAHGGYFWIAYTDTEIDRFDNLNLCYAASLAGPWRLHANNPVRRDPRNARCGGTPFRRDGKLYRPAQDCAARYGAALRIMEIITCTPMQFAEREVTLIQPEYGLNPHGFHTLSACGDKCLVDGKRLIFSPRHIMVKILQRLTDRLL